VATTSHRQSLRWLAGDGVPRFAGVDAWGHVSDIGGDEAGVGAKPSDLLPLSLAACTAHDVVVILRKQRQDLRDVEVAIETVQDQDPPWTFRRIALHFTIAGRVDPERARKAIELTERKYCSIHATLRSVVELRTTFEVVEPR